MLAAGAAAVVVEVAVEEIVIVTGPVLSIYSCSSISTCSGSSSCSSIRNGNGLLTLILCSCSLNYTEHACKLLAV